MKWKIVFGLLFLSISLQFIFINIKFPEKVSEIVSSENIYKTENEKSVYTKYSELKDIRDLKILKINKNGTDIVGEVYLKGNCESIKEKLNRLDKYRVLEYKLKIDKNNLEIYLSII